MVRSNATFADAAAECLRYCREERGCKPSTLRDYASSLNAHLLPGFGDLALEDITAAAIDEWRAGLPALSPRTKNKLLVVMHGVMGRAAKVWGLPANAVAGVERHRQRSTGDLEVFSPEEVMALVRAAASDQDSAIYLTAAFTGLRRGELIALRWRDVDLPGSLIRVRTSFRGGELTSPKSGKVRSVPMAPDVASTLAALGRRELWTADDDLVFPVDRARISTAQPCAGATRPLCIVPPCGRCASTTCDTRSVRG
jgi:integrase